MAKGPVVGKSTTSRTPTDPIPCERAVCRFVAQGVSRQGVSDAADLPVLLVRWFEGRLHESVGFCLRGCRLYGLEVIDPQGLEAGDPMAARVSFLAEADDRQAVVLQPAAREARAFDAAAMVTVEWRSGVTAPLARPGEFAPRRRARVVDLLYDDVAVTVIRFENDADFIVLASAS